MSSDIAGCLYLLCYAVGVWYVWYGLICDGELEFLLDLSSCGVDIYTD